MTDPIIQAARLGAEHGTKAGQEWLAIAGRPPEPDLDTEYPFPELAEMIRHEYGLCYETTTVAAEYAYCEAFRHHRNQVIGHTI